jgi:hypothetical protein
MTAGAVRVLRVGLGVTFVWIGVMIFQDPLYWGGFLQPWMLDFLPVPLHEAMIGTAVLDTLIGLAFVANIGVWIAGLVGSIHLAIILITSGITEVTVRDIGLLGGTLALSWDQASGRVKKMMKK